MSRAWLMASPNSSCCRRWDRRRPPMVKLGRMTNGKPSCRIGAERPWALFTSAELGTSSPSFLQASLNHRRVFGHFDGTQAGADHLHFVFFEDATLG